MKFLGDFELPFDNLYKFLSIFGLVGTIFCFAYQPTLQEKENNFDYKLDIQIHTLESEIQYLEFQIKELEGTLPDGMELVGERYSNFDKGIVPMLNDTLSQVVYNYGIISQLSADKKTNLIITKMNSLGFELDKKRRIYKSTIKLLNTSFSSSLISVKILTIIGYVLSVLFLFGITLWYLKLQKLLDKQRFLELQIQMKELTKPQ